MEDRLCHFLINGPSVIRDAAKFKLSLNNISGLASAVADINSRFLRYKMMMRTRIVSLYLVWRGSGSGQYQVPRFHDSLPRRRHAATNHRVQCGFFDERFGTLGLAHEIPIPVTTQMISLPVLSVRNIMTGDEDFVANIFSQLPSS